MFGIGVSVHSHDQKRKEGSCSVFIIQRVTKHMINVQKKLHATITPVPLERSFGPGFGVFFGGEAADGEGDGVPQPPRGELP